MALLARLKTWGKAALATYGIALAGCLIGETISLLQTVGAFNELMLALWLKRIGFTLLIFGTAITLYMLIAYAILNAIRRRALGLAGKEDSAKGVALTGGVAATPPMVILLLPPTNTYPLTGVLMVTTVMMIVGAFLTIWRITGEARVSART